MAPTTTRSPRLGASAAVLFAFADIMAPRLGRPRIALDAERGSGPGGGDRLKGLLADRTKAIEEMRALIDKAEGEDRDLTAEEQTRFDELKATKDRLTTRIDRLEDQASTEADLDRSRGTRAGGPRLAGTERHTRGPEARKEFENLGEFLHAVRFNRNDQRLQFVEGVGSSVGDDGEMRAEMRMDDGASGGFAVPKQFIPTLRQITPQQAIIRPRAEVLEAGSPPDSSITMPALNQTGDAPSNMYGGVEVNWIEEGGDKPETDMTLREVTLTPHEVAGFMTVTDKLLRNWGAASGLIERQLRAAIAQSEDRAFLTGNGVGKPLGVLSSPAVYRVPRGQANRITYTDVVAIFKRLQGDGVFFYSKSILDQLMTLQNPNGQYIWTTSAIVGQPNILLGRPAIENNRNPILGSYGDLWAADLSNYLIKDGSGPFVAASEHVKFTQNKTVIKAFWNVDGTPWLTAPFQLENGYEVSPFVALDVPMG